MFENLRLAYIVRIIFEFEEIGEQCEERIKFRQHVSAMGGVTDDYWLL